MPTPKTDHLLDVADALLMTPGGKPRQVNLRRAISSAYYAVFHRVMTAIADEFVGASLSGNVRYGWFTGSARCS